MKIQILFLLISLFINVDAGRDPRKPRFKKHSDAGSSGPDFFTDLTASMKEDLPKVREMSKRVAAVSVKDKKRFEASLAPFERRLKSLRASNSEDPKLTDILNDIRDTIEFIVTHFAINMYDYSSQGLEDTISKAYDLITRFLYDTLAIQMTPVTLVQNIMYEIFKNIYNAI